MASMSVDSLVTTHWRLIRQSKEQTVAAMMRVMVKRGLPAVFSGGMAGMSNAGIWASNLTLTTVMLIGITRKANLTVAPQVWKKIRVSGPACAQAEPYTITVCFMPGLAL